MKKRYLLDTHALLWMLSGDPRLGSAARKVICNPGNQLYFSLCSYWEICIKISLGKLELAKNWKSIIDRELSANAIEWLPIRQGHLNGIIDLPFHHRDPFDRLLIAQAKAEGLSIITADAQFQAYGVSCVI